MESMNISFREGFSTSSSTTSSSTSSLEGVLTKAMFRQLLGSLSELGKRWFHFEEKLHNHLLLLLLQTAFKSLSKQDVLVSF